MNRSVDGNSSCRRKALGLDGSAQGKTKYAHRGIRVSGKEKVESEHKFAVDVTCVKKK